MPDLELKNKNLHFGKV